MSLAPLLAAPTVVQVHAFAALAALGLGVVQLSGVKGSTAHRPAARALANAACMCCWPLVMVASIVAG